MRARIWGARGSLAVSGPEFFGYGGNTSCVEVRDADNGLIVLDAGTGLRRLGDAVESDIERVDLLLTHFHMDHLFGFGFFSVLFRPDVDVHVWGPATETMRLRERLNRYLSPPLFPVRLPDLPSHVHLHEVPIGSHFDLPGLEVHVDLVSHPGRTVGYRLDDGTSSIAYMPDHEPALGWQQFPGESQWTSGAALAGEVDLLIHDAQYTDEEYPSHVGWGHSATSHAVRFADLVGARHLVGFHHDPGHDDYDLIDMWEATTFPEGLQVSVARESAQFDTEPAPSPAPA